PLMPFVTEEIHGFVPGADGKLAVRAFPRADPALIDPDAERELQDVIDATRRLRRYRDIVGVPAATHLPARLVADGDDARDLYQQSRVAIQRLSRFQFEDVTSGDGAGADLRVSIPGASVEILPSEPTDPEEANLRIAGHREAL